MNSRTTHSGLCSSWVLGGCLAIGLTATAMAQQQRYYQQPQGGYQQPSYNQQPQYQQPSYDQPQYQQPQQYENPLQFLPKFGHRMSEMVRRLFYGQNPTGYDAPPPGAYGQGGAYSLDSTPRQQQAAPNYPQQPNPGYAPQQPSYQYPAQPQPQSQPRYNYPPQQQQQQQPATPPRQQQSSPPPSRNTAPAPPPSKKSATSSSNHKYSPPKITESDPPKTTHKSPTVTHKKETPPAPPPTIPTPTKRRSESTPKEFPTTTSSGASGSFLKGRKTAKPGRVISPYAPYKELDITGLESGSLALDPTTQKVFEVP